ncbi:MAG: transglycosylase SLT domain-containing protein [Myxococcota bacterium]
MNGSICPSPICFASRWLATFVAFGALFSETPGRAQSPTPTPLDAQRQRYFEAQEALDADDLGKFQKLRVQLDDYPLHPYLDYRQFTKSLEKTSIEDFEQFIKKYRHLPFIGTVRSRFLLQLDTERRFEDVLKTQTRPPKDQDLRCVYYRALYNTGRRNEAFKGAKKLWLNGKSVSGRCDPLFEAWRQAGGLTDDLILDRMLLGFAHRNGRLMRYLQGELSNKSKRSGDDVLRLYNRPRQVGRFAKDNKVTSFNQALAKAAYKRLVRRNIKVAVEQLPLVASGQHLTKVERQALAERAASALMSTDDARLARWRDRALKSSESVSLLERRIRLALRHGRWARAQAWIRRLPKRQQKSLAWTFWRGRLTQKLGNNTAGREILATILGQRSFYSAAAATILGRQIEYPVKATPDELPPVTRFSDALARVQELIDLRKISDTKREWRWLLARCDGPQEKLALAHYAYNKRWYHLTVQATISGKLWDYMTLRFPIAFKWWFDFFSKERDLPTRTMLAIARLESALDTEAHSGANARGLLQLLPSTAKEAARRIKFRYEGASTLFDAGVNIRLGSYYLKRMIDRCDGNRVVAFASYNAGYTRVKRWRKETAGKLDVYAFVEQIPFNETRGYVQNGLMFEIYYSRLLGERSPLLTTTEKRMRY